MAFRGRLSASELSNPRGGNRFDSPDASYSVLYFSSSLEGCFGETLARLKPDPRVVPLIDEDWKAHNFMPPGSIPADWRHQRLAVRAKFPDEDSLFLDVEAAATHRVLEGDLRMLLGLIDIADIDVAAVRGGDRRLTRIISYWAWSQVDDVGTPRYAGVRYLSRLNSDWECWAVFEGVVPIEQQRRPISLDMPELERVARHYNLTVH